MKKNNKIITIIIPTRNRFLYITKILNENKGQNKNVDIILIDDCSEIDQGNKVKKYCNNFKNVKYFRFNKNRGQSYACNFGLKKSKTNYVWFFDDDDFLDKKTLLEVIIYLKKENFDAVLLPMKQIYKHKLIKFVEPIKSQHTFKYLVNSPQKVSTSCAIFNRKKILNIGGWDEQLFGGTDTDLFLRFSKNYSFSTIKTTPISVNFAAPNRVTNNFFRQQKAKLYLLNKHWQILTLKRKIYYIISFILCFPILNSFKTKLKILNYKINE